MNIFKFDNDIKLCAQYHPDRYVVKMPLEYAQLLCTARHELGESPDTIPYKRTHRNHPCAIWARASSSNYNWLCILGLEVCAEYTYRYNKTHACANVIIDCLAKLPKFQQDAYTPWALAMPDQYKHLDEVTAYRDYFNSEKRHLFAWKNREVPNWIIE